MVSQSDANGLRVLRCGLGGETYALDMARVRGIQSVLLLRRFPDRPDAVGKLTGPDGDVSVFSLAQRLGRPAPKVSARQQVVVLHAWPRPWGLLVDRVAQTAEVPAASREALPGLLVNPSANYFRGVIRVEGEWLLLLSPDRLHPDAEPFEDFEEQLGGNEPREPAAFALPPVRGQPEGGQVLVFSVSARVQGERPLSFGVSITRVAEVLETLPVVPVPGAADFVLGLAGWRGRPVPVIDLARRLGLPSAPSYRRLMIVRPAGPVELLGFPVRSWVRVLRLPLACRPSSRELPLDPSLVRGAVELARETLVVPDLACLASNPGPATGDQLSAPEESITVTAG
jgi:chemotaxis signal transduction protein